MYVANIFIARVTRGDVSHLAAAVYLLAQQHLVQRILYVCGAHESTRAAVPP